MRLLALTAALTLATPCLAELPAGTKAPNFSTQATLAGKPFAFALDAALKKGPVVLYFFPAAFTSGCTIEAHEFAEATPEFQKLGATVIGVSADSIDKLNKFSVLECRNKFPVAVATPSMIKDYDAALIFGKSNRTSYVIAPDGKIIYSYKAIAAEGHVANTLAAVKNYEAAHPTH